MEISQSHDALSEFKLMGCSPLHIGPMYSTYVPYVLYGRVEGTKGT